LETGQSIKFHQESNTTLEGPLTNGAIGQITLENCGQMPEDAMQDYPIDTR
jgi:hypothetical protein